jgi:hypothetical protein
MFVESRKRGEESRRGRRRREPKELYTSKTRNISQKKSFCGQYLLENIFIFLLPAGHDEITANNFIHCNPQLYLL